MVAIGRNYVNLSFESFQKYFVRFNLLGTKIPCRAEQIKEIVRLEAKIL